MINIIIHIYIKIQIYQDANAVNIACGDYDLEFLLKIKRKNKNL